MTKRKASAAAKDSRVKGGAPAIRPRNPRQKEYMDLLRDANATILVVAGPAGTGKTMLAVHEAAQQFKEGFIERIVITRPAVSTDEEHGFLPGDINEKMEPWVKPMTDILREHFNVTKLQTMLKYEELEFSPLAYMRGRTFKNCFVVADEMQNSSVEQMKMLLTRIGEGSRIAVTGDLDQHDRGSKENGMRNFMDRLRRSGTLPDHINVLEFDRGDIERHPAVTEVLAIYESPF